VACADVCDGWCVQVRVMAGGCRREWRLVGAGLCAYVLVYDVVDVCCGVC
jgi:hypothetical protein